MGYLNADIPELRGYDTGLVLGNLDILDQRMDRMLESTVAELWELAEAVLRDAAGDPDTLDSILLSLQTTDDEEADLPDQGALSENRPLLHAMQRGAGLYRRLVLYRFIAERRREAHPSRALESSHSPSPASVPAGARGRIAYMPNAFANKAYMRFSEHVPDCRAVDFHSFVDACEEVYNGLCEFCILPIENTADGKLTGFCRLIVKYRLQIAAVCDIENRALAGENTTRFALLRRATEDYELPPQAHIGLLPPPVSAPLYLELLHVSTAAPTFEDVLTAATFCGLRLVRADTLPPMEDILIPPRGESVRPSPICAVWDASEADLDTFGRFLSLEASDDLVLGLYPKL